MYQKKEPRLYFSFSDGNNRLKIFFQSEQETVRDLLNYYIGVSKNRQYRVQQLQLELISNADLNISHTDKLQHYFHFANKQKQIFRAKLNLKKQHPNSQIYLPEDYQSIQSYKNSKVQILDLSKLTTSKDQMSQQSQQDPNSRFFVPYPASSKLKNLQLLVKRGKQIKNVSYKQYMHTTVKDLQKLFIEIQGDSQIRVERCLKAGQKFLLPYENISGLDDYLKSQIQDKSVLQCQLIRVQQNMALSKAE